MKFLSKLGKIVLAIEGQTTGLSPIIKALLPAQAKVVDEVTTSIESLSSIIALIEVAGQSAALPGAQKLAMATPLVKAALMSSALARHGVANPALAEQGAKKIADGLADFLNALKEP